jgi:hypothetical protein
MGPQEKLLLEQTKQLLSAQINDLQSRVGALLDSQQAAVAFPELAKMDQNMASRHRVRSIRSRT